VHFRFGGGSGLLVGNPPPEKFNIPYKDINMIINKLINRSRALGIRGGGVTPYLLEQIGIETGGESLKTNVELAVNNVHLGALLATATSK
jgi:pseudouridine-5'-phosphate glycosidase